MSEVSPSHANTLMSLWAMAEGTKRAQTVKPSIPRLHDLRERLGRGVGYEAVVAKESREIPADSSRVQGMRNVFINRVRELLGGTPDVEALKRCWKAIGYDQTIITQASDAIETDMLLKGVPAAGTDEHGLSEE